MRYILHDHIGSANHGCEALVRTVSKLLGPGRTVLLSDLRLLCDSPGRLDEFYTGRAAEGISQSPAELAAALCAVTAEDVCAPARRVRPDALYTLEEA